MCRKWPAAKTVQQAKVIQYITSWLDCCYRTSHSSRSRQCHCLLAYFKMSSRCETTGYIRIFQVRVIIVQLVAHKSNLCQVVPEYATLETNPLLWLQIRRFFDDFQHVCHLFDGNHLTPQCDSTLSSGSVSASTFSMLANQWKMSNIHTTQANEWLSDGTTGSALAAAGDIHRQMPTYMADIRPDWLTNQNTDWCFVVIGLSTRQSHSPLQQLKIDPVCQLRSAILVGSWRMSENNY